MPQIIEVPGYGDVEFSDGMTDDQISFAIQQNMMQTQPKKSESIGSKLLSGLGQQLAGNVRGVGSVVSTLASPFTPNLSKRLEENLIALGANPESINYRGGKIAGEALATAPVGGILAKIPQAAGLTSLANATRGFGFGGKNLISNLVGGATAGAGSAALINPEDAGQGAIYGAAIPAIGAALKPAGNLVADVIGGIGTHTGGESLRQAALAGKEGGERAKLFRGALTKDIPVEDVLTNVKSNIDELARVKNAQYKSGMIDVSKDKTILSFDGINKAIKSSYDDFGKTSYGTVKNQRAVDKIAEAETLVNQWMNNAQPDLAHTPQGFDDLKQAIGAIYESTPYNTQERAAVGKIYNSVKNSINTQAPTYSKVMKDYAKASEQLSEVRTALSSNKSADAALRKLQSVMRNNVNTNYGNRLDLAKQLEQTGGNYILPQLAGQSLSTLTPRGLGGAVAGGLGLGAYGLGGLSGAIPTLAIQSPRLMGELAYGTGKAAKGVSNVFSRLPIAGILASENQ
jgi:hypothetical protein